MHEQAQAKREDEMTGIRAKPAVQAILKTFPGAQITRVQPPPPVQATTLQNEDGDVEQAEPFTDEDL